MTIFNMTRYYNKGLNGDYCSTVKPSLALMYSLSNGILYYSKKKLPTKLFNYYLTEKAKNGLLPDFFSCHFDITWACKPYLNSLIIQCITNPNLESGKLGYKTCFCLSGTVSRWGNNFVSCKTQFYYLGNGITKRYCHEFMHGILRKGCKATTQEMVTDGNLMGFK